ncbi:sulfatase family protein [Granulicella rosea]|nr:sulfatase-like hydrolase/transferase [Granulicella rosea]
MPNILWICADQQRADTIAALGNAKIRTPNLDKLVGQSTVFTNAFCQTPICGPSRGSFLTGRYPRETGLRSNAERIHDSERIVPRILADYGYDCGLVGKLHLSPADHRIVEVRTDDGYRVFEWSHDLSDNWPGKNQWRNWLATQNVVWPEPPKGRHPAWGVPIDPKYTQTAWCAQEAIKFMREHPKDKPWLMSVNIYQPHAPFHPTEEYLSHYKASDMPAPAYREGELANKPKHQQVDHQGAYGGTGMSFVKTSDEEHLLIKAAYYAMIEQVDTEVGRMMAALEELGMADNTIVVYQSDHGEMQGDHGIYMKGPYFYDCLTRVPLIIRWPGHVKTQKIDALVELTDLAPTLLEAAGVPVPPGMQGRSLYPILTGKKTQHRDSVYIEYYDAVAKYDPTPMATCVRTERYKCTYYQTLATGELYDLQKDPGEFDNLWNVPQHAGEQMAMMEHLLARMIQSTDPLPLHQF